MKYLSYNGPYTLEETLVHTSRLLLRALPAVPLLVALGLLPTLPAMYEQAPLFSLAGLERSIDKLALHLETEGPLRFFMGRTPRDLIPELARYLGRSLALVLPCVLAAQALGIVLSLRAYRTRRRLPRPLVAVAFLPIFLVAILGQSAGLTINQALGRPVIGIAYLGGVSFPLLLSVGTLLLPLLAYGLRSADRGVAEIAREGYVSAARARGLPERSIAYRHIGAGLLHRMELEVPKAAATAVAALFVVERVFNLPGLTRFLIEFPYSQEWYTPTGARGMEMRITVVQIQVLVGAALALFVLYLVAVLVTRVLLRGARRALQ